MPVAAFAVVAGVIGAGPVIAAVQGDPALPERTAGQLLADAAQASRSGLKPMSGTVMQTASFGLPGLPEVQGGMGGASPTALLVGSHELKVWYGGESKLRLALPGRMSETDLIVNGDQVWLWESEANKATRVKVDAGAHEKAGGHPKPEEALPTAVTPQQLAQQVLQAAEADTVVSVTNTERVADRAAYQLVLAPKDASSLVKEVKLALDGETFVPLRIQVYAKSSAEPAFEVGFTSVTFSPPAAENFTFTPPAGAKVEEKSLGTLVGEHGADRGEGADPTHGRFEDGELKGKIRTVGDGWTTVAVLPVSERDLRTPDTGGQRGQDAGAIADTILKSAKPISGAWGSGKVIQTKLVSALLTDDGRLLVGAVTPEKLAEAAGRK
ncbi:sigma-E factor regulatory protein RseB domain-containing protein [Streptosporangium fragile]|uniref:Sigma-E factor regulatory protein RseB domain-containing protein n=1 Tax=Streptosporangium fragile TaxID=46186 RepID=A0ABP6IEQ6_9ACTN